MEPLKHDLINITVRFKTLISVIIIVIAISNLSSSDPPVKVRERLQNFNMNSHFCLCISFTSHLLIGHDRKLIVLTFSVCFCAQCSFAQGQSGLFKLYNFTLYTFSQSACIFFLNSPTVFRCPYLPPLSSFLLFPSLCWGCLFSLSLCHHSSGMSVAEWSSVLSSRSAYPLFRCTEQNLKNMPGCYFLLGVGVYGSSLFTPPCPACSPVPPRYF